MSKPVHIVLTTINHPHVVTDLLENTRKFGREGQAKIWIVGDLKTPASVAGLAEATTQAGLETVYLSPDQQKAAVAKYGAFHDRLPWNNECRRNLGYLDALADGCEVLLSIDDDNFPLEDDFVGGHLQTGRGWTGGLSTESNGFYNVCEHLELTPSRMVFPRGFPFRLRGGKNENATKPSPAGVKIGCTAGLWLSDPDIDATTWLNGKVSGLRYTGPATFVLDQNTWSPVNTQNTSVIRELIPAYLCVPMGWDVPGGKIQRYGDIWGGYFLQALMRGTEWHVAFGAPVVDHRRNPHDYLDDLRFEFWGMVLTDWLVAILREQFRPTERDMTKRVLELGVFLRDTACRQTPKWCPPEVQKFLEWTAGNLTAWGEACQRLG